jgi:hypothetical protein
MKTYTIIVLSDGETYSGIDGASIITITEEEHERLESGTPIGEIKVLSEIVLRDVEEIA